MQPDAFVWLCAAQLEVLLEPVFQSGKEVVVSLLASILCKLHAQHPQQVAAEGSTPPEAAQEAANVRPVIPSTAEPLMQSHAALAAALLPGQEICPRTVLQAINLAVTTTSNACLRCVLQYTP